MADSEEPENVETTPANDVVVTKYKMAGDMVNAILKELIAKCKVGVTVLELCEYGDSRLNEETSKVFKKDKEMKKGIAFPTCVSINNCICHFSPLKSDPPVTIKEGDVVKIDLGAHVDGYIAVVAHTVVVGASKENPATGRKADAVLAAQKALEVALRLVKPGNTNYNATDGVQKVTEDFKCKPIEGMLSHQLKRHIIDGEKAFIQNPTEAQRKEHESCDFEVHEVYAIDILVSSGEGKGRELDTRTTVYKKKDIIYQLKMKASRQFLSETDKKFLLMPFTLRAFEDEKKAKMGVLECVKHDLMQPFNVLYEREGEFVAQYKQTVILMPNGPLKITGLPLEEGFLKSEYTVSNPESVALLSTSISKKAAKKKKKKAGKSLAETTENVADAEEED
ncbi:proliferation-associated protein 2G4 [Biomphalaria glabrata]|uniref:Proliferation-associated protein 2G4-like n=1 Tax=Biomphalaria glabrata TaxID=6526 RepID=A0A2C9LW52_BIOGL|nr:proliferation-associated protein 2G4-like [Biomphalaria glabrata]KAI8767245.1 proliferation-associated protein 2G4 [Biomphalaria glabrata]